MTRTMYDSVTVGDIPKHAAMIAGYVDGNYANLTAIKHKFPHAQTVSITVNGSSTADVCDCETGDATPGQAAAWAKRMVAAGREPTIYCNRSTWAAVKGAVTKAGVGGKVHYWIADWTGHPHLLTGSVATQYADPLTSGGHYDTSLVADHWPGVDPHVHKPSKKPSKHPSRTPHPHPAAPPSAFYRRWLHALRRYLKEHGK